MLLIKILKLANFQLVQVRRERDFHREAATNYEKKIEDEHQRLENERKKYAELLAKSNELEKKVQDLEGEVQRLNTELMLTKEAHKADKKLWQIEKNHYSKSASPAVSFYSNFYENRKISFQVKKFVF